MHDLANLTATDKRRFNAKAHKEGKHLCTECLAIFEYTEANFYKSSKFRRDGTPILSSVCKGCKDAYSVANKMTLYNTNPDARERMKTAVKERERALSPVAKRARYLKIKKAKAARKRKGQ